MLRAVFEHIEATPELSWRCFRRRDHQFEFGWHFHREYELTLITEGSGTRFVGDSIEEYRAGDLALIGPDLPHTYASTLGVVGHEAVVAQFRGDFLGVDWLDRPEFAAVADLLRRSRRGLTFPGIPLARPGSLPSRPGSLPGLPESPPLRPESSPGSAVFGNVPALVVAELDRLSPAEQTIGLLTVLVGLARCADARPLASVHYSPVLSQTAGERIDAIVRLLHAEYAQRLSLASIARVAHLSPAATSRFFRRTTGSTITAYVNTLRVNAACRLLVDTDRPVADIAGAAGYQNLSHFNRRFQVLKGLSPREYRARFSPAAAVTGARPR